MLNNRSPCRTVYVVAGPGSWVGVGLAAVGGVVGTGVFVGGTVVGTDVATGSGGSVGAGVTLTAIDVGVSVSAPVGVVSVTLNGAAVSPASGSLDAPRSHAARITRDRASTTNTPT